jgi:hypothetical protein
MLLDSKLIVQILHGLENIMLELQTLKKEFGDQVRSRMEYYTMGIKEKNIGQKSFNMFK